MEPQGVPPVESPRGFISHVANVGIKDETLDFMIVASEVPCVSTGVFTLSRFAGPCVKLSRDNLSDGSARAVVVISKNANVATGGDGDRDTSEVVGETANLLGIPPEDVVVAGTGVIGRRWPMDLIHSHFQALSTIAGRGFDAPADLSRAAEAIMTTDTHPKTATEVVGEARIVGIAKGVGMIEPDMATLLAFFFTDARLAEGDLEEIFRRVTDKTFNCLSIDGDTSTSDTAVVMANGLAGSVDLGEFEESLYRAALSLVLQIARDGEGATKLIEVIVDKAHDEVQARYVAKLIVNSPLVKTAVHGADPNWGRVAMAVGKAWAYDDIDPEHTVIRFGDIEVYPADPGPAGLDRLGELLSAEEVLIHVSLNNGSSSATVWGCDLSEGYIRINADYTT